MAQVDAARRSRKSEIRNPKSETNPNSLKRMEWGNRSISSQLANNFDYCSADKPPSCRMRMARTIWSAVQGFCNQPETPASRAWKSWSRSFSVARSRTEVWGRALWNFLIFRVLGHSSISWLALGGAHLNSTTGSRSPRCEIRNPKPETRNKLKFLMVQ